MWKRFVFGALFTLAVSDASAVALLQCPDFGGYRACHVRGIFRTASDCRASVDEMVRWDSISSRGLSTNSGSGIFVCYAKPAWPRG